MPRIICLRICSRSGSPLALGSIPPLPPRAGELAILPNIPPRDCGFANPNLLLRPRGSWSCRHLRLLSFFERLAFQVFQSIRPKDLFYAYHHAWAEVFFVAFHGSAFALTPLLAFAAYLDLAFEVFESQSGQGFRLAYCRLASRRNHHVVAAYYGRL